MSTRAKSIAAGRALLLEIGGNCGESWAQNDKTYERAVDLAEALAAIVGAPTYNEESGRYWYPPSKRGGRRNG